MWRVEFQLKRKVLKEFQIFRVDDLFGQEDKLWLYLTSEWLVLKNNTGLNVSRWKRILEKNVEAIIPTIYKYWKQ